MYAISSFRLNEIAFIYQLDLAGRLFLRGFHAIASFKFEFAVAEIHLRSPWLCYKNHSLVLDSALSRAAGESSFKSNRGQEGQV
jgi:hypothetical protein